MVYKLDLTKAIMLRKSGFPTCSCDTQGTIANSLTCVQLHKRAEKIAVMLMERGRLQDGDHVALVYPPGKRQDQQLHETAYCTCWGLMTGAAVLSPRIAQLSSHYHLQGHK